MDETSRVEQQVAVLLKWLEEESGGVGIKQSYRYNVENFSEAGIVYLHRPAFRNKGCDFTVRCIPLISRDDGKKFSNPRHQDLVSEILYISHQTPTLKAEILGSINDVYEQSGFEIAKKTMWKRIFLEEMNKVVPWRSLVALVESHAAPGRKSGRPLFSVETMKHQTLANQKC